MTHATYKTLSSIRREFLLGSVILSGLVIGVGGWAASASVSSAVIGTGEVVLDGNQKQVQHLEGGIVEDIRVREGQIVEAGELLVRLDGTADRARLLELGAKLNELIARRARLRAEASGAEAMESVAGPGGGLADLNREAIVRHQRDMFAARRQAREAQITVFRRKIEQLAAVADNLRARVAAKREQTSLLGKDIANTESLVEKGHATHTQLRALRRELEEVRADMGGFAAEIGRAEIEAAEAELRIAQIGIEFREQAVAELGEVETAIQAMSEQYRAAEDRLRRLEVRAPQSGRVLALEVHTRRGVVQPGQSMMRIVPEDALIIEARVEPQSIDRLQPGQTANVRLSAFNQQTTPELLGQVETISADRLHDSATSQSYYLARVRVSKDELARLGDKELVPGMPAEVFFEGGERTVLSYLVKPLSDQLERSFREE